MEMTYQLGRDDYWHYNAFVIGRVPALKRQTLVGPLIIAVILVFDLWAFHPILNPAVLFLCGTALFGAWLAFTTWTRKRVFLKSVEAKPGSLGLHTLALSAEGVREQSDVLETRVKWPKVTEIAQSKQLIVFFLGPRYGFIVPLSAFSAPEHARAFLETAQAYHRSALNGTMPNLPPVSEAWPPAPQRLL